MSTTPALSPADDPADPLAAVTHPDPYPWYRRLALHRPFHRDAGIGLWVAAGRDEVDAVLLAAAAAVPRQPSGTSPTFGAGAHRCPGQALAAVLADATISGLLARGVQPARLAQCYRYRPSLNARMPEFL